MSRKFLQCKKCYSLTEIDKNFMNACKDCSEPFDISDENAQHAIHVFRSGYFEHLAPDPIYIRGKNHLREVCSSLNVTSHYIH